MVIHAASGLEKKARTMRRNRNLAAALFLLALLSFMFLARGIAAERNPEWEKTVAAAKKEGRVAIFLYQRDNIEAAVKAFEQRYPEIQVDTVSTAAAETGPRIMAERRAGKYLWDVCLCGPTTPFAVLYAAKALDPIKSALILPEVLDETKWWAGKHHYMDADGKYIFVFLGSVEVPNVYYNKNLVEPKELNSFWDLLKSRWRGKLLALDPRQPGRQRVQARLLYHMPELGPGFLKRFFSETNVTLSREDRQAHRQAPAVPVRVARPAHRRGPGPGGRRHLLRHRGPGPADALQHRRRCRRRCGRPRQPPVPVVLRAG